MKTDAFINLLENNLTKPLQFLYPSENLLSELAIPETFHITEIKNAKIDAVDCGGNRDQYNETIVQIWVNPNEKMRKPWTAKKALSIFNQVNSQSAIDTTAELYVEFSHDGIHRIIYDVETFTDSADILTIQLSNIPTLCKPSEAVKKGGKSVSTCC